MRNLDSSSGNGRRELHARLPAEAGSAHAARRELDALSPHLQRTEFEVAELLASELVTNSIRHSGTRAVELDVVVEPRVLHVEVRDDGSGFEPSRHNPSPDGHWGLQIVDELADRWGVEPDSDDTKVWFEIDRAA